MNLEGNIVALITPFLEDGEIDFESFRNLIKFMIDGGIDGILIGGTTGERPTIKDNEFQLLLESARNLIGGRVKLIAGAGSNSTLSAIKYSKLAKEIGVDAILSVGPYYNKPSEEGYYAHFSRIADEVDIPCILYNVPGRTGSNIPISAIKKLSSHPNIVGIKEASGDLGRVAEMMLFANSSFSIVSGDDALTLPMISLGARGVISVVANIVPDKMSEIVRAALSGEYDTARETHYSIYPLMKACFYESNPIPVKYALHLMNRVKPFYRLPLTPPSSDTKRRIEEALSKCAVI